MRFYSAWLLAGLVACDATTGTDSTFVPPEQEPPAACGLTILDTRPSPGDVDAYYRSAIEFRLDGADPRATVVVPGVPGTSSLHDDGQTVSFTPDAPLEPDTAYSAELQYCTGTATIDFATSELGEPLMLPPDALIGRTFSVRLSEARFLAGDAIADVVASVFTDELLVGVVDGGDGMLALRIAVPDELGTQDLCSRTLDLPSFVLPTTPFFDVTAHQVDFDAYAGSIHLRDFTMTGTWSADLSWIGGATLDTTLDARDLADMLGVIDVPTLCNLAEGFGAPCQPCADDEIASCVPVQIDHGTAEQVPGPGLVAVDSVPQGC